MEAIGPYRIEREVARGGASAVFRALDPRGQAVAIKLLRAGAGASQLQRRRAATEVQALLRLRHPNVVPLLDAGEHQGVPYVVLEWIEGCTLVERLEREGPLPPAEAIEVVRRLAVALEHCHAQGVLHRDLKPANVILRARDGEPLLSDFGLSKDLLGEGSPSLSGTRADQCLGTPGYWPPEQARGDLSAIGPRSDVYGLGAILFALLTGRPPQEGGSLQELAVALERPPAPPSRLQPGVPPWLDEVVLRALDPDPARRPADPRALVEALSGPAAPVAAGTWPGRLAAALLAVGVGSALALVLVRAPSPASDAPPPAPDAPPPASDAPDAPPAVNADEALRRGEERLKARDWAGASEAFSRAIELDPDRATAWNGRGIARARSGDRHRAYEDFSRAIELDPREAGPWFNRGRERERLGDLRGALEDFTRAIELAPRDADSWLKRSFVRERLGDWAGEQEDASRAIELDPGEAQGWVNRGVARVKLRDYPGALADCSRAIELEPGLAQAWVNRGVVRKNLDEWEGAIEDFSRAIELDPANALAWLNRGWANVRLGRPRSALLDYDRALALEPKAAWAEEARQIRRQVLAQVGQGGQ